MSPGREAAPKMDPSAKKRPSRNAVGRSLFRFSRLFRQILSAVLKARFRFWENANNGKSRNRPAAQVFKFKNATLLRGRASAWACLPRALPRPSEELKFVYRSDDL